MDIIRQIQSGIGDLSKFNMEPDRRTAIGQAVKSASTGDLVIIAGKGHETYIELKDTIIPFDDREVAREFLREKASPRRSVAFGDPRESQ
jgi:UDP-N-acetylmuramoyl-L-alanyl-D-glutamate--2,6-diaminopimelate ligase